MFCVITADDEVKNRRDLGKEFRDAYKDLDFEEGIEFANRYEELFNNCIDEEEEYELYWKTLKDLLRKFTPMIEKTYNDYSKSAGGIIINMEEKIE
jgi:hypothetical protein